MFLPYHGVVFEEWGLKNDILTQNLILFDQTTSGLSSLGLALVFKDCDPINLLIHIGSSPPPPPPTLDGLADMDLQRLLPGSSQIIIYYILYIMYYQGSRCEGSALGPVGEGAVQRKGPRRLFRRCFGETGARDKW